MFVLTTVADTIRIPPSSFVQPTLLSVQNEIEKKYPNRVVMDVGLVICLYHGADEGGGGGSCESSSMTIGDGVLAPGDGGAHHEVVFQLLVFRPFVGEVMLGTVLESTQEGIRVGLGDWFFDVFVPAPRMQRPSRYDSESGLWVWTPSYGADGDAAAAAAADGTNAVKTEGGGDGVTNDGGNGEEDEDEEQQFEIEIGSRIRFRVKAINFTRVTNTVKGVQATTTTTGRTTNAASVERTLGSGGDKKSTSTSAAADDEEMAVRRRSSSADLTDSKIPASMHITASICEEGLGLTSWWTNEEEEDDDEEDEVEEE